MTNPKVSPQAQNDRAENEGLSVVVTRQQPHVAVVAGRALRVMGASERHHRNARPATTAGFRLQTIDDKK